MFSIQSVVWDDAVTIEKAEKADLLLVNMHSKGATYRSEDIADFIKLMPGPLDATYGTAPNGDRMLVSARIPMQGFNGRDAKMLFPLPGSDLERLEQECVSRIVAVGSFAEPLSSLAFLKVPKED